MKQIKLAAHVDPAVKLAAIECFEVYDRARCRTVPQVGLSGRDDLDNMGESIIWYFRAQLHWLRRQRLPPDLKFDLERVEVWRRIKG